MFPKIKRILFFVILAASLQQPLGAIPITSATVDCASTAGKVNCSHRQSFVKSIRSQNNLFQSIKSAKICPHQTAHSILRSNSIKINLVPDHI
jgi:hypothetical protein